MKRISVLGVILLLFLALVGPSSFTFALGTPEIYKIDPPSPQPVGTCVTIGVRVTWDSEFRAMRVWWGNQIVYELGAPQFETPFCTGNLSSGTYTIRVEVASLSDLNWSSPTVATASYELLPGPQPPPGPQPGPPPAIPPQGLAFCWRGQGFGYRDGHNYVWFVVAASATRWEVSGPFRPQLWANPDGNGYAEAGFLWPGGIRVIGIKPSHFKLCAAH